MAPDSVQRLLEQTGAPYDVGAAGRLRRHHHLLLAWNRSAHLVSAGDADREGLARHDAEALQALPYLGAHRHLLDVGSGGGYPGLIWACCRPELTVTLVEANQRKAAFLRQAAHDLGLDRVRVAAQRVVAAAEIHALGATLWTSRAAGCADLLLAAGAGTAAGPLRLILYAGAEPARAWRETPPARWTGLADEPLASGAPGRLVVFEFS